MYLQDMLLNCLSHSPLHFICLSLWINVVQPMIQKPLCSTGNRASEGQLLWRRSRPSPPPYHRFHRRSSSTSICNRRKATCTSSLATWIRRLMRHLSWSLSAPFPRVTTC